MTKGIGKFFEKGCLSVSLLLFILSFNQLKAQPYKILLPISLNADIVSAKFSPVSYQMITASKDNIIRIWDYRTKKVLLEINSQQNNIEDAFFSPDGKKIISISNDNAKCWDLESQKLLNTIEFDRYVYTNIGFTSDSKKICAKTDGQQLIWDLGKSNPGDPLRNIKNNSYYAFAKGTNKSGTKILAQLDNAIELVTVSNEKTLWKQDSINQIILFSQFHEKTGVISAVTKSGVFYLLNEVNGKILLKQATGINVVDNTHKGGEIISKMPPNFSVDDLQNSFAFGDSAGVITIYNLNKIPSVSRKKVSDKKIICLSHTSNGQIAYYAEKEQLVIANSENEKPIYHDSLITTLRPPGLDNDQGTDSMTLFLNQMTEYLTEKSIDQLREIKYFPEIKAFLMTGDSYYYLFSLKFGRFLLKANKDYTNNSGALDFTGNYFLVKTDYPGQVSIHNIAGNSKMIFKKDSLFSAISDVKFNIKKRELILFPEFGKTLFNSFTFNEIEVSQKEHPSQIPLSCSRIFHRFSTEVIFNSFDTSYCFNFFKNKLSFRQPRLDNIHVGSVFLGGIDKFNTFIEWDFTDSKIARKVKIGEIGTYGKFIVSPTFGSFALLRDKIFKEDILVYDLVEMKTSGKIIRGNDVWDMKYTRDGENLIIIKDDSVLVYDRKSLALVKQTFLPGAFNLSISDNKKYLAVATMNNNVILYDFETLNQLRVFNRSGSLEFFKDGVMSVDLSDDNKYIIAKYIKGSLGIWRINDGKLVSELESVNKYFILNRGELGAFIHSSGLVDLFDFKSEKIFMQFFIESPEKYLFRLPNGYYKSSKLFSKEISYFDNKLNTITFDQLDIKYNRPDKVLEAIGSTDTALINSYRQAYFKRIKKLGIDTTSFKEGFTIPEADFKNRDAVDFEQKTKQLKLQIAGKSTENLDRFNVWINEVPLYGRRGISLRSRNKKIVDTTVTITLSEGDNQVETSVTDVNGTESYRQPLFVKYIPEKAATAKTYFIGIGINRFADSSHNLSWSVKDIRDLSKRFAANGAVIDTLFDEKVTKERILALKKKLESTSEEDKVVIAYSGHGLLSKEYDYFLSTYNVSFSQPEDNGLPYDELESLLDGIKARKKLMLIDACHSGEVDKEEMQQYKTVEDTLKNNNVKKGIILENKDQSKLGMKNSFELMQELFVNVGRSTGATIISAAAGTQFALERSDLQNGVFTFALLDVMNKHKSIKVSDLKNAVTEKVPQLTGGLQKPTFRNENQQFDWSLW